MFQKQGESFELLRLCRAPAHLLVPASTKNRQLLEAETTTKIEVCLAFIRILGYIREALYTLIVYVCFKN